MQKNSLLSAVPYLCMWIFSVFWSLSLDWARNSGRINTTTTRKLSTGIGLYSTSPANYQSNSILTQICTLASLLPAACFIGVGLVGCDRNAAVALMTLGTMFMAGMYCGFLSNHIDIASNYAGTLMALTNTAATIPGFIVPVFVGEMTHGNVNLLFGVN